MVYNNQKINYFFVQVVDLFGIVMLLFQVKQRIHYFVVSTNATTKPGLIESPTFFRTLCPVYKFYILCISLSKLIFDKSKSPLFKEFILANLTFNLSAIFSSTVLAAYIMR